MFIFYLIGKLTAMKIDKMNRANYKFSPIKAKALFLVIKILST